MVMAGFGVVENGGFGNAFGHDQILALRRPRLPLPNFLKHGCQLPTLTVRTEAGLALALTNYPAPRAGGRRPNTLTPTVALS